MSSKRGRKRNDNLPPNRARDVQRAFRARRAAHLQALEQRVSELEQENDCLRLALRLPPSTRPPLGKGPTGKDKAKNFDPGTTQLLAFSSSRESSAADSPLSRESSGSPSGMTVSMSSSHPMTVIDNNWNDPLLMNDQQHQQQPVDGSPSNLSYPMAPIPSAPMTAPLAVKPLYSYNATFPSSARSLSNALYSGSPTPYHNPSDRPVASSYAAQNFSMRADIREESARQQYSYPAQSYVSHDPNIHSQTSPPNVHPSPGGHTQSHHSTHRESPLPYPTHRRSLTDSHEFSVGSSFTHLSSSNQPQHSARAPDYMREQDGMHVSAPSRSYGPYAPDGRLNPMP